MSPTPSAGKTGSLVEKVARVLLTNDSEVCNTKLENENYFRHFNENRSKFGQSSKTTWFTIEKRWGLSKQGHPSLASSQRPGHWTQLWNGELQKKQNRVVRFLEVLHNNSDDRNVVERIAKRLVSWAKTITLYVRFTFSYISLPSCSKQELDMTRLRFWGERDRPTFYNLYELE